MSFCVATWNINSIRVRLERVKNWLKANQPDVLCLQETKIETARFPHAEFEALGYQNVAYGQKTYNGVAILARHYMENIRSGFEDGEIEDGQARLLAADVMGFRVISAYVPNGMDLASEKYVYKQAWLKRLKRYLQLHEKPTARLLLVGDLNIAPSDLDVADPLKWQASVLCDNTARALFTSLCEFGLHDLFRVKCQEPGHYSWWDYRELAFVRNDGLRIDHILGTSATITCCKDVRIDRLERKGEKPSDHVPVVAEFDP